MITGLRAVLLISPNAEELAQFYREVLRLPLVPVGEGRARHYYCELSGAHFAIRPADGWSGTHYGDSLGPVVSFETSDIAGLAR